MTTFGILSVAMGVFYAVMSARMVMMGPGGVTSAEAAGTAGGMATMIWFGGILASALMIGAGIGCLKVTPWAWKVSMTACALGMVVFGSWMWATSFGVLPSIAVGYVVVFGAMNLSPSWKAALCGTGFGTSHSTTSTSSNNTEDEKKAAA